MFIAQAIGAQVFAEDVRFGELGGGMEALENELVFLQRGSY